MESFIFLVILLLILITIIIYQKEKYQNNKEIYYKDNMTKKDIKNFDTLIIDTKYTKKKDEKLLKFIEENHFNLQKIILIYTEKFNKTDILNKINDNSGIDLEITEENLSYYNVYFREK